MGPILIFDKSAIEALNPDQAVWLEHFFITNIIPIFYIETLADLEKEVSTGRTPEQIVGGLANKVPEISSYPNVHHSNISYGELLRDGEVEMKGRIMINRGKTVAMGNEKGVIHEQSPEAMAFERWIKGDFLEVERGHAKKWREQLKSMDFQDIQKIFKILFEIKGKPKTLEDVKSYVDELLADPLQQSNLLAMALNIIGVPPIYCSEPYLIWEKHNKPLLKDCAPYTAWIVSIDLFFYVSISAGIISGDRVTNKIDFSYLYYLPFCSVFVSGDNLHAKIIPFFLRPNQSFVSAIDLKAALQEIDTHFSGLPQEVKDRGVFSFAHRPPVQLDNAVTKLWDKHNSKWREKTDKPKKIDPKIEAEILKKIREFKEKSISVPDSELPDIDKASHTGFSRMIRGKRGKWNILPPEITSAKTKEND